MVGAKVIGICGSLMWSKTLVELIFNPCGEFRWSSEGPVSQVHSPHLYDGAPGIFSDLLRSIQMLKREWSAESNGKLPNLFNLSKTATLVPEFAVQDLPFGRAADLVPEFEVKDLSLGRTLWWWYDGMILFNDGHAGLLHLRSETVVVHRQMNMVLDDYDGQIIPGDECGLNFLTFVSCGKPSKKTSNRKLTRTGDRIWARWVKGNVVIPRPQRWSIKHITS